MSLHVLVRFQHYFFFNEICGLLTKRANMNTHQALAIFRVTFHWMPITGTHYATRENSGPGYKRVYPRAHCCRMNTLVIRSIHCRGRLNVTFSSQVFVIVDVRLESTQLWKKCFKNIQTEEFQTFRQFYQVIVKFSRNTFLRLVNQTRKKEMSIIFTTCSLKLVNKQYR